MSSGNAVLGVLGNFLAGLPPVMQGAIVLDTEVTGIGKGHAIFEAAVQDITTGQAVEYNIAPHRFNKLTGKYEFVKSYEELRGFAQEWTKERIEKGQFSYLKDYLKVVEDLGEEKAQEMLRTTGRIVSGGREFLAPKEFLTQLASKLEGSSAVYIANVNFENAVLGEMLTGVKEPALGERISAALNTRGIKDKKNRFLWRSADIHDAYQVAKKSKNPEAWSSLGKLYLKPFDPTLGTRVRDIQDMGRAVMAEAKLGSHIKSVDLFTGQAMEAQALSREMEAPWHTALKDVSDESNILLRQRESFYRLNKFRAGGVGGYLTGVGSLITGKGLIEDIDVARKIEAIQPMMKARNLEQQMAHLELYRRSKMGAPIGGRIEPFKTQYEDVSFALRQEVQTSVGPKKVVKQMTYRPMKKLSKLPGAKTSLEGAVADWVANAPDTLNLKGYDLDPAAVYQSMRGKTPQELRALWQPSASIEAAKEWTEKLAAEMASIKSIGRWGMAKKLFRRNPIFTIATVLGAMRLANGLSSNDEDYMVAEGMQEGGMAMESRHELTDFGSGFLRLVNKFRGMSLFKNGILDAAKFEEATVAFAKSIGGVVKSDSKGFGTNPISRRVHFGSSEKLGERLTKRGLNVEGDTLKQLTTVANFHEVSELHHATTRIKNVTTKSEYEYIKDWKNIKDKDIDTLASLVERFQEGTGHFGRGVIADEALAARAMGKETFNAMRAFRESHATGFLKGASKQQQQDYIKRSRNIYSRIDELWDTKLKQKFTSTSDKAYSIVPKGAMYEGPMATEGRHRFTDFGSAFNKFVNKVRGLKIFAGKAATKGFSTTEIRELAEFSKTASVEDFAKRLGVNIQKLPNLFGRNSGGGMNIISEDALLKLRKLKPSSEAITETKKYLASFDLKFGQAYVDPDAANLITKFLPQNSISKPLSNQVSEEMQKTLIFHEAAELKNIQTIASKKMRYLRKNERLGEMPQHDMTLAQEELFLRSAGYEEPYSIFKKPRSNTDPGYRGYSISQDRLTGLRDEGVQPVLRKLLTDFGSPWQGPGNSLRVINKIQGSLGPWQGNIRRPDTTSGINRYHDASYQVPYQTSLTENRQSDIVAGQAEGMMSSMEMRRKMPPGAYNAGIKNIQNAGLSPIIHGYNYPQPVVAIQNSSSMRNTVDSDIRGLIGDNMERKVKDMHRKQTMADLQQEAASNMFFNSNRGAQGHIRR